MGIIYALPLGKDLSKTPVVYTHHNDIACCRYPNPYIVLTEKAIHFETLIDSHVSYM